MILQFLANEYYDATTWHKLGLQLGIYETTLRKLEQDNRGKTEECLRECLSSWLKQVDGVKEKGAPSWFTLATALDAIKERSIAKMAYRKDLKGKI